MGAGFGSCKINVPRDMHREDFQFSTSRRQKLLSFTHGWLEDIEQSRTDRGFLSEHLIWQKHYVCESRFSCRWREAVRDSS